ncbi:hypothetical protein V5799_008319 [Amblyomma americanum]|uniref:Secreted protein n=1 Tax=Amblyomma americanum TaxID=6943 RepID=A0AAQ4FEE8_AMBAM
MVIRRSLPVSVLASLLALCAGQVMPDGCTMQDQCHEAAAQEALQLLEQHDQLAPLCVALKNETGFMDCTLNYGSDLCDSNPWSGLSSAFVDSLCSEASLRAFAAPQLQHAQCLHFNFAVECATKSLGEYESLAKFLRSARNDSFCSMVSKELRHCAEGVYEGCQQKGAMRAAVSRVVSALLGAINCQESAEDPGTHHDDQRPQPGASDSSDCETRMTRVMDCLQQIVSPNTVAKELLEKVRTQPMDYDETFCRTYENVIECKSRIVTSDCHTKAARGALERNIKAFSMARSWLCDDRQKKLREFAVAFQDDRCDPNDDAINECSQTFVHNVSQSGPDLSHDATDKLFQTQLDCIRGEFQTCAKALPLVDGYLEATRTAFVKADVSGAPTTSTSLCLLLPFVLSVTTGRLLSRSS